MKEGLDGLVCDVGTNAGPWPLLLDIDERFCGAFPFGKSSLMGDFLAFGPLQSDRLCCEEVHYFTRAFARWRDGYGWRMLRRFTVLLGLGMMVYGGWLIRIERPKNLACNASVGITHSTVVTTGVSCIDVAWVYFGSFVLVVVGFVVTAIGFIALRKAARGRSKPVSRSSLRDEWEETQRRASLRRNSHDDPSSEE